LEHLKMSQQERLPIPTDGYDDDDGNDQRLIRGEIAKAVDGIWSIKNGGNFPPKTQLLALSTATALQHWQDGLPVETIVKTPGKPFPSVAKLNEAIPANTWELGIDDKPRPPWVLVEAVYLLDPKTAAIYTHINSTVGTSIAVRNLRDKVKMMRMLRNSKVVPLVELDSRPMPTKRGIKMRPEFTIIEWLDFATTTVPVPETAKPMIEHMGQPVEEPTLSEILDDGIPDFDDAVDFTAPPEEEPEPEPEKLKKQNNKKSKK
jgi:hypothetical protein